MARAEATIEELVRMNNHCELRLPEMQRATSGASTRCLLYVLLAEARAPIVYLEIEAGT